MTRAEAPLDAGALRTRAHGLAVVAAAADRAAARFAAHALTGPPDPEAEAIRRALAQLAQAHRAAGGALTNYAGELEGAAHRRLALDELVEAAHTTRTADRHVLDHVRALRDQLVGRMDHELDDAAARCAAAIEAATPTASSSPAITGAVVLALGHARSRLLELAGPDPATDPSTNTGSGA